MSNDMIPFDTVERMGAYIAKSGLFGMKNPEQAVALMLLAQAEGRHPVEAARDYHIIQGRPALKADTMLARFQLAGGKIEWHRYDDQAAEATFSHPQGGSIRVAWTMEMARNAGLTGKDNWRQYPRAMLRARVVSEGIRTVYPAVLAGFYTPEEVQDFDSKPVPEIKPAPDPVTVAPEPDHDYRVECSKLSDELGLLTSEKKRLYDEAGHDYAVLARHLAQLRDSKHTDTAAAAMAAAQRVRDFSNFPAMPTQPQPEPQTDGLFEEPQA